VEAFALSPTSSSSPQGVAKVLFDNRKFGLDGQFDVCERSFLTAVGGDSGKNPGAALLIHQGTRTVEGVGDNPPNRLRLLAATRKYDLPLRQSFRDEQDEDSGRDSWSKRLTSMDSLTRPTE